MDGCGSPEIWVCPRKRAGEDTSQTLHIYMERSLQLEEALLKASDKPGFSGKTSNQVQSCIDENTVKITNTMFLSLEYILLYKVTPIWIQS